MRSATRRLMIMAFILVIGAQALSLGGPTPALALLGDRRPNLQMVPLRDWRVETTSSGHRLLRFTTIFANAGRGPFELRGQRSSTSDPTMEMDQVIFRTDGTTRRIATDSVARYAGDGHDHWHVQGVVTYEAWKVADAQHTRRGAKAGFCFFDTTPWKLSLPNARQRSYYREEWCGTRNALTNRVGVSVGWGDRYPWNFAYQWIDITGLAGGIWMVRATVDIQDHFDEMIETDNCAWAKIRIPAAGSGRSVTVYDRGRDCGVDAVTPVTTYPTATNWDPARAVVFQPGTYVGYSFNSAGTALDSQRRTISSPRSGTATARATPPGQSGRWLYINAGTLAGYWYRQTASIDF